MGVQSQKELRDAARHRSLPTDATARKALPITRGVLDYFPAALAEVAKVSVIGNEQHNPGEPLHWAKEKSTDHSDCIARHLIERGSFDTDGARHSAKLAWRALALLQTELEDEAESMAENTSPPEGWTSELRRRLRENEPPVDREIPAHELPHTEPVDTPTHELVQVGKRAILLPTPEEVLRRIREMEHVHSPICDCDEQEEC